MTERKALIVADSPDFDLAFVASMARGVDSVIVTDGAVNKLPSHIPVSLVCGDFDSIDLKAARETHPGAEFLHTPDQSMNDLEKAIILAQEKGVKELYLACSLGGLIDQSTANLSVLIKYHKQLKIHAHHRGTDLWVISSESPHNNPLRFGTAAEDTVSVIPLVNSATVTISNVQGPLQRSELSTGSQGVSNRALGGPVEISVERGLVIAFHRSQSSAY